MSPIWFHVATKSRESLIPLRNFRQVPGCHPAVHPALIRIPPIQPSLNACRFLFPGLRYTALCLTKGLIKKPYTTLSARMETSIPWECQSHPFQPTLEPLPWRYVLPQLLSYTYLVWFFPSQLRSHLERKWCGGGFSVLGDFLSSYFVSVPISHARPGSKPGLNLFSRSC